MKATSIILASCAVLALAAGPAGAGQCTGEIDALAKVLAARDAGSGPSAGAASGVGQHPPTTAMSQADQGGAASAAAAESGKPQHPPTATMNRETTGNSSPMPGTEVAREQHPPTAVMGKETHGAASPQDVQRQTQGQPTAAEQPQGQIRASHDMASAMAALERARMLDRQGSEAECLSAVGQAKLIAGTR
jgi:hypothetical protein